MSLTAAAAVSASTSASTTAAPAAASWRPAAAPIPLAAPVTRATRPCRPALSIDLPPSRALRLVVPEARNGAERRAGPRRRDTAAALRVLAALGPPPAVSFAHRGALVEGQAGLAVEFGRLATGPQPQDDHHGDGQPADRDGERPANRGGRQRHQ